jgi:hypothetical protein
MVDERKLKRAGAAIFRTKGKLIFIRVGTNLARDRMTYGTFVTYREILITWSRASRQHPSRAIRSWLILLLAHDPRSLFIQNHFKK